MAVSFVELDCEGSPLLGARDKRAEDAFSWDDAGTLPVLLEEERAPPTDGLMVRLVVVAVDGPVDVRLLAGGAMLGRELGAAAVEEGRPLLLTVGVVVRDAELLELVGAAGFVGDFVGDWPVLEGGTVD